METARLQGSRGRTIKWPNQMATGPALLGNTVSINALQKVCAAILRTFGHDGIQDPWGNGQATAAPRGDMKKDNAILPPGKRTTYISQKKASNRMKGTENATDSKTKAQPGTTDPGSNGDGGTATGDDLEAQPPHHNDMEKQIEERSPR